MDERRIRQMGDATGAAFRDAGPLVGKALDSNLIEYRCVRPEHRPVAPPALDRVFVYKGGWAYCEAGKLAGDHQLIPTVGLSRHRVKAVIGVGRTT